MASRRKKKHADLGEHQIFGDETAAQMQADLADLRSQMVELTARINAQFTSIAAHAEISQQEVQLARNEARADMERSRDTVIGLIDQLRGEVIEASSSNSATADETNIGAGTDALGERIDTIETTIRQISDTVATPADTDALGERIDTIETTIDQLADTVATPADTTSLDQRIDTIETAVGELTATIDACLARQHHLADTMSAFIDTILAQHPADPLADLSAV